MDREAEDAYHRFTWAFHAMVDGLVGRLDPGWIREAREYVEYDEAALGVDDLLAALVLLRVPITSAEREELLRITTFVSSPDPGFAPYLHNKSDALAALRVRGEPDRPRNIGPLQGGHQAGTGRRGTTEFPSGWVAEKIEVAGRSVAADRDAAPVRLANGRRWSSAEYDGVMVAVVLDEDGSVRSVFPTAGTGVHRNHDVPADRDNPTLRDLVLGRISDLAARIPADVAEHISDDEMSALRDLHVGGEWAELADVLAARLTRPDLALPVDVRESLRILLMCFDLPIVGCTHLNNREELLAAWDERGAEQVVDPQ